MEITIFTMLIAVLVIMLPVLVWFGIDHYLNPRMETPDGIAKVSGSCGDTMEIALKFNGPRVEGAHSWTDGCSISKMCVDMAALLARGKTVPELGKIDTAAILDQVGNLPDTHIHCAVLAETTLRKAVENYMISHSDRCSREADCRGIHHQMDEQKYFVCLFPSVSYALKAEKLLNERGINLKMIPVPRHISSDCGVCIRITADQQEKVIQTLRGKVVWEDLAML
ncbi:MAG: putative Se/S carrier-like protein [Syntrophobacteraceae bacterium]